MEATVMTTMESVTTDFAATEPATTELATTEPTTMELATTEPATTEPGTTELATTEPETAITTKEHTTTTPMVCPVLSSFTVAKYPELGPGCVVSHTGDVPKITVLIYCEEMIKIDNIEVSRLSKELQLLTGGQVKQILKSSFRTKSFQLCIDLNCGSAVFQKNVLGICSK